MRCFKAKQAALKIGAAIQNKHGFAPTILLLELGKL
jgi:hypothetical protein